MERIIVGLYCREDKPLVNVTLVKIREKVGEEVKERFELKHASGKTQAHQDYISQTEAVNDFLMIVNEEARK